MKAKEQKPYDIAKSGPQSYRLLQEQNARNFKIDAPTSKEYLYEKNQANAYLGHSMYNAVEAAPTVVQSPLYNSNTKLGQSYFDQDVYNKEEFENAGDVRAENQPAIIQAINGTTKGAILAGTTALSGILGIPYGIASAAINQDFSKLWDNDVTRVAQAINDAAEEWLPNYYTKQQTEGSWYSPSNIFSANFIFDKVIKNIGFTVGAAYSGGLYTKGINLIAKGLGGLRAMALTGKTFKEAAELGARAMNMSNATRVTKALVGSVFSATAEGTIEALNNSKDYVDIYRKKYDALTAEGINDAYREFAINGGQFDGNGNPILDNTSKSLILQDKLYKLQRAKEQAYKEIDATRASMGNADLLANLPILTLGNWLTFGKMFAGGYKAARNTSKVTTRATKEAMAAAKAEGKEAVERLNNIVKKAKKTGYQGLTDEEKALVEEGTNHLLGDKAYAALMAVREPLKEGNEEMAQAAAAKSSQNYYGSRVDAIYDAAMDNNSRDQVLNWWQASMQGFKDIYGDFNNYEEGFIGALTGLMGSPTFGKKNNSTSETYLGRSKWIGMSGGVVPQWRNAIKGRQDEAEIVSHVNRILKSGNLERDIKHLIAQTSFDNKQKVAAIRNDKMSFKDSELASIFENIMYLKEAGKIDLLNRAIDNMDSFTEEDAKSILDLTKKEIGLNGENLNALNKRKDELVAQFEELVKQKDAAAKAIEDFKNSTEPTEEQQAQLAAASDTINRINEGIENINNTIDDINKQLQDKKSSVVSPYSNEDGDLKTPTEVLEDLNKRKEKHKKILDFITGAMDSIDASTNEALTNDQLKTLTWYKVMMLDWKDRANSMGTSISRFVREFLNDQDAIEELARLDKELKGVDVQHLTKEELQTYGGAIVSRNILKNIIGGSKSIVKLLEDIESNSKEDMGLALARLLNEDKEIEIDGKKQKIGDYLFNAIKTNINANAISTQDDKNSFITTLSDLRKIGENYNTYNKLLTEYTKNPSEIDKAHQATTNRAEREVNNKKSKSTKNKLRFDGAVGDLTKDLRDNKGEIENIGIDEFKDSLDEKQLKAFEGAESLLDGIDSIEHKINTSDLEDEVKGAMLANLDDSIEGVNNVDELLEKLSSVDPSEALEKALEASNLDDIAKLDKIEELEAQYREFIEQDLSKVAKAIEAKRKAQIKDIEERAKKAADALDKSEEERIKEPKERKIREPKERKKRQTLSDRKKTTVRGKAGKEEQPKSRPSVEEDKEAVKKQGTSSDITYRNKRRKEKGYSNNFANRPQLSETFFYGRDLLTYVQYIKENPSRIPKFVASRLFPSIKTQEDFIKAYTKYIEATYQYLKDNGAFEYVKYNLKANDKLIFTVDEELNNKAGVPVVIIKAIDKEGNSHVVGTMKTELDFMSINTKTDLTYGTTEAAQKKLYDEIVYKYKASKVKPQETPQDVQKDDLIHITNTSQGYSDLGEIQEWAKKTADVRTEPDGFGVKNGLTYFKKSHKGGRGGDNITIWFRNEPSQSIKEKIPKLLDESKDLNEFGDKVTELINTESSQINNEEFIGAESSVKRLMGGDIAFSDTESSISSIFNNTGSTITFGVVNDSGMISTTNSNVDSKILQVDVAKAKEGQVYVLIPSNNGSLLPALCYGTTIEELLEKPNDWYIEETIKAIQSLTNIAQIGSNKNNVAKWLGISTQTINISVGHLNAKNKFTEDTDITNADKIRVAYNDAKGNRKYMYITLSDDKTISHDNAKKFIESFASRFSIESPLTVNLNTQRLMDKDYINNMSKYYFTNIVQGQTHSVNDWFTYNKTQTEIDNEPKEIKPIKPTKKPTETTPTGAPKISKDVTMGDNTYTTTSDGRVYNDEDKLVVGEERTKVLDEATKSQEESKEEPTEKQEEKDKQEKQEEKPTESVDLASQILGGAKRGRRRAKPEEKKEDKKKDDDNRPEINQDQIDTTRTRQNNNRRRRPIKPSSESSESTSTSAELKKTVRQKSIDKAISIFPNIDKSRIEGIVNRIFDTVESNTGAMQILEDIKTAVSFFKKASTPIGNISTRAYNNFINAVLDPIEKEELDEEATREFNIENKDFNLRTMEIIDKVSSALREYLDGYITVKSKVLLNIFKIIRNTVNVLGKNTIVLNNFFNNILAETTSIITGEPVDSGTKELRTRYAYNNLSDQVKSWLNNRGTNIDAYNRLSPQQQESYIRCMI